MRRWTRARSSASQSGFSLLEFAAALAVVLGVAGPSVAVQFGPVQPYRWLTGGRR